MACRNNLKDEWNVIARFGRAGTMVFMEMEKPK